jgi:glyoxylase-like metal-dependent hydrolase (beta-lactamase superfamily II)
MKTKQIILCMNMLLATMVMNGQNTETVVSQTVGDTQVFLLSEGQNTGNAGILLDATPEMIAQTLPDGSYPMATNAFLIKTPDKNILVDAGYGRHLVENLSVIGLTPESIDIILLTHMHGDHIGGLLKDGQKVFPKAHILVAQAEHDYWVAQNNTAAINIFQAYSAGLVLFTANELDAEDTATPLLASITAIAAPGHTPGHTAFLIESQGDKLMIWGDLAHAMAIQMPYPEVAVRYDSHPEIAIKSRQAILKYVAAHKITIAGMHIAWPGIGKIEARPAGGYVFVP